MTQYAFCTFSSLRQKNFSVNSSGSKGLNASFYDCPRSGFHLCNCQMTSHPSKVILINMKTSQSLLTSTGPVPMLLSCWDVVNHTIILNFLESTCLDTLKSLHKLTICNEGTDITTLRRHT